ncbi:uncharacterized protein Dmoj_GI26587 [Drosophila mojavensis]|uniref:Uncharacterized protein n=1 Tax=Drosophila mojavensis TaxID=7230 RepID=A0A0Q9XF26_DROMO|nr:uncharacterized protein Dmoj_GI26587 [Drosophila mojavensis]
MLNSKSGYRLPLNIKFTSVKQLRLSASCSAAAEFNVLITAAFVAFNPEMIAKHIICIINELHAAHATGGRHRSDCR